MNWTGSSGLSGARTSPPRATRTGQYVKRSVPSFGPTMRPGRTFVTRPGMAASAAFSHSALRPPYVSSVTFSTVGSLRIATGPVSSTPGLLRSEKTEIEEMKTYCFDVRGEERRGVLHLAREVARGVDDRVPGAPLERLEVAVAVALQLLELGEEAGVRLAPVEERDRPAARLRGVDDLGPEEAGASEDEEGFLRSRRTREARPPEDPRRRPFSRGNRVSSSCLFSSSREIRARPGLGCVLRRLRPPASGEGSGRSRSSSASRAGSRRPRRSSRPCGRSPRDTRSSGPGAPRWPG